MPDEFWREVVDRVAQEVPDTLLLAEAFWMMEGYFVRTLGMHRVYNSAFMNMLKNEENAKYRATIKNTLEFDPEILKRFVNFMNNPDEETAVAQFGKDDKYFGVCVLMLTLPGLPMFGHGQVEGFTEKYGMEYRRAYWDEQPDRYLVERHEREIFPLLHRRYLFADVDNFRLYDFFAPEGGVNEDVYAYCNRVGDERALVVYHNKFDTARGWIRMSVAYSVKAGGDERQLIQTSLGDGLALGSNGGSYTIFRDHINGLEYIRSNQQLHEQGLYIELEAFKYQVFLDFRQVQDSADAPYGELAAKLNGRPVPSIAEALREHQLQPILGPFHELVNAGMLRWLMDNRVRDLGSDVSDAPLVEAETKMAALVAAVTPLVGAKAGGATLPAQLRASLEIALCLPILKHHIDFPGSTEDDAAAAFLADGLADSAATWGPLFSWLMVHELGALSGAADVPTRSRQLIDEWMLGPTLGSAMQSLGLDYGATQRALSLVKLLTTHQQWFAATDDDALLDQLLADADVRHFIGANVHEGVSWFNQELFEELLWWLFTLAIITTTVAPQTPATEVNTAVVALHERLERWRAAASAAGYQIERLLAPATGAADSAPAAATAPTAAG